MKKLIDIFIFHQRINFLNPFRNIFENVLLLINGNRILECANVIEQNAKRKDVGVPIVRLMIENLW